MGLEPNRPPCGGAFEASSLEDEKFKPNKPRDGIVNASLLPIPAKKLPVEPAFELGSFANLSKPNRLSCGRAFEASLLEDGAIEPNRPRDGIVNASSFAIPPKKLPVELDFEV